MANVSIKERILRQIASDVAAITGVSVVVRFSARGRWYNTGTSAWIERLPRDAAMVVCQSDEPQEEALNGPVFRTMTVAVGIKCLPDNDDTTSDDVTVCRWEWQIEQALASNPTVNDGTDDLAVDVRVLSIPTVDVDADVREFRPLVLFEIDYQHDLANVNTLNGRLTLVTE